MSDSVVQVSGIAPPTTNLKLSNRKASTTKTGLPFDAFLHEEVQPKQAQEVTPAKEEPKSDKCQNISQDDASQPVKDDKSVNSVQCVPATANIQQNSTPKETGSSASEGSQSGSQAVLSSPIKIDSSANPNTNLAGDIAAAVTKEIAGGKAQETVGKEAFMANNLDTSSKEASAAQAQQSSSKDASTSNPQPAPDQSGKNQFSSQLSSSLDKTNDFQVTAESHPVSKANTSPTPQAAPLRKSGT